MATVISATGATTVHVEASADQIRFDIDKTMSSPEVTKQQADAKEDPQTMVAEEEIFVVTPAPPAPTGIDLDDLEADPSPITIPLVRPTVDEPDTHPTAAETKKESSKLVTPNQEPPEIIKEEKNEEGSNNEDINNEVDDNEDIENEKADTDDSGDRDPNSTTQTNNDGENDKQGGKEDDNEDSEQKDEDTTADKDTVNEQEIQTNTTTVPTGAGVSKKVQGGTPSGPSDGDRSTPSAADGEATRVRKTRSDPFVTNARDNRPFGMMKSPGQLFLEQSRKSRRYLDMDDDSDDDSDDDLKPPAKQLSVGQTYLEYQKSTRSIFGTGVPVAEQQSKSNDSTDAAGATASHSVRPLRNKTSIDSPDKEISSSEDVGTSLRLAANKMKDQKDAAGQKLRSKSMFIASGPDPQYGHTSDVNSFATANQSFSGSPPRKPNEAKNNTHQDKSDFSDDDSLMEQMCQTEDDRQRAMALPNNSYDGKPASVPNSQTNPHSSAASAVDSDRLLAAMFQAEEDRKAAMQMFGEGSSTLNQVDYLARLFQEEEDRQAALKISGQDAPTVAPAAAASAVARAAAPTQRGGSPNHPYATAAAARNNADHLARMLQEEEDRQAALKISGQEEQQQHTDAATTPAAHAGASRGSGGGGIDRDFARMYQEEEDRQAAMLLLSQETTRAQPTLEKLGMLSTNTGRAFVIVQEIIDKVEEMNPNSGGLSSVRPIAKDDMVYLAERLLGTQEQFIQAGKPCRVDLGFHFTNEANMDKIKTDGLLTRRDRQQQGINSIMRGSFYGDGVYTANNPFTFNNFGGVGLLVARLQGRCLRKGHQGLQILSEANGYDTVIGNKSRRVDPSTGPVDRVAAEQDEIVLTTSSQVLPLIQFPRSILPSYTAGNADVEHPVSRFQSAVKALVDEYFNSPRNLSSGAWFEGATDDVVGTGIIPMDVDNNAAASRASQFNPAPASFPTPTSLMTAATVPPSQVAQPIRATVVASPTPVAPPIPATVVVPSIQVATPVQSSPTRRPNRSNSGRWNRRFNRPSFGSPPPSAAGLATTSSAFPTAATRSPRRMSSAASAALAPPFASAASAPVASATYNNNYNYSSSGRRSYNNFGYAANNSTSTSSNTNNNVEVYSYQAPDRLEDRSKNLAHLCTPITNDSGQEDEDETCPICWDPMVPSSRHSVGIHKESCRLISCGHCLHVDCLKDVLKRSPKCPVCRANLGGPPQGQSPSGTMEIARGSSFACNGHHTGIKIEYNLRGGIQMAYHDNPGVSYSGDSRVAYLPDNSEGNQLLKRLIYAFQHGLTFRIGTSLTTGQPNRITWASIHHKTSLRGGPHGFPDPAYFINCNKELDQLNVPANP